MAEGNGRGSSVDPTQDDCLPGAKEGAFAKTLPFLLQVQRDYVVATCAETPKVTAPGTTGLGTCQPDKLFPCCLGVWGWRGWGGHPVEGAGSTGGARPLCHRAAVLFREGSQQPRMAVPQKCRGVFSHVLRAGTYDPDDSQRSEPKGSPGRTTGPGLLLRTAQWPSPRHSSCSNPWTRSQPRSRSCPWCCQ